jgi:hypothetical protein
MSRRADREMTLIARHLRDLAPLDLEARERVTSYVASRIRSMPVTAAADHGNSEDEPGTIEMFPDPPIMPPLRGATK